MNRASNLFEMLLSTGSGMRNGQTIRLSADVG